ncbi:hypothetical protein [Streptomyces sp. NPDC054794]
MADGARVFLGFSEALGNSSRLMELAAAAGSVGAVYGREVLRLAIDAPGTGILGGELNIDYVLYEFRSDVSEEGEA